MPPGGTRREELSAFLADLAGFARWRLALAVLLICLGAAFEGLGLLLLVPLIGLITAAGPPPSGRSVARLSGLIPHEGGAGGLAVLLLGFLALMAVRALVLGFRDRMSGALQIGWADSVRGELVGRLARAEWSCVSRLSRARIVQALGQDSQQLAVASEAALKAMLAAILLAGLSGLAVVLAPVTGPLALAGLAAAGLISRPFLRRVHELGGRLTRAHLAMTGKALRFLDGLKLAAAEGERDGFAARYVQASAEANRDRFGILVAQANLRNLSSLLAAAVAAATLFAGIAAFHMNPALLAALLLVLARTVGPALSLQQALQQLFAALPAHAAIRGVIRELAWSEVVRPLHPGPPAASSKAVRTSRLSFRHEGGKGGICNLDLAIGKGEFIGVAGPSGAGKTTFLDLVAGILPPQSGEIAVANRGAGLAYVGQDPVIFDGTVRDNLTWSRPDASDAELWAGLRLVRAEALVRGLSGELDGQVGERGVLLSAGERQRLALARALVRRPRLLILDEATNAIDLSTEAEVLDALAGLPDRPTILMAAHRLESFRRCDRVIGFVDGRMRQLEPSASLLRETS